MIAPIKTEQQLREAMLTEECEHLEFKATSDFAYEELCKYCVALSNEGGGNLVLGVTDKIPRKISETCCFKDLNKIKACLLDTLDFRIHVYEIITSEGRVLAFFCPSRPIGIPLSYHGQYLMRSGQALVPMTHDELRSILAEASPDYSASICEGATISDLAPEAIKEFRRQCMRKSENSELAHLPDERLLRDTRLTDDEKVTYAALVLFGKPESVGRFLPQAELIFEYRNGEASIDHQDRVEYRAGFFLWADAIWDKINTRNEMRSYQEGLYRREISAFNEDVVREALLNAVTHREYHNGSSIFVRQFPNRMEIASPGGFPSGVTVDNIISRQAPRNRLIAEAFQHCGLVERAGQGADRMFRLCIQEGKGCPDFDLSDSGQVLLILGGQLRDSHFVKYLNRLAIEQNMNLTLDDLLVLEQVREGTTIRPEQGKRFQTLVEQGAIEKIGSGQGEHYVLAQALYRPTGKIDAYRPGMKPDEARNRQIIINHITNSGGGGGLAQQSTSLSRSFRTRAVARLVNCSTE